MKLKYVFVLEAIFSLLTGIGLAVTPKIVLSLSKCFSPQASGISVWLKRTLD